MTEAEKQFLEVNEKYKETQKDFFEVKRQREEKEQRDIYYSDVSKIRKIAQYFFGLSIISIVVWLILLLL